MGTLPTEPNETFKEFAYEQIARIGKALSSPQRLILLNILCQGQHTVDSLAKHSGLSVANASQHLQTLKAANLVEVERQGTYMLYSVADEGVRSFFFSLQDLALHRLAELRQALSEISSSPTRLEAVDHRELMAKVTNGEAVSTSSCAIWDGATWASTGSLPTAASFHTQLPVAGGALVTGGFATNLALLGTTAQNVLHDGTLAIPLAPIGTDGGGTAQPRAVHSTTALHDGTFLIYGGGLWPSTRRDGWIYTPN